MFNLEQLEELEKVFAKQHNLVGKKRAQLAARLHLTENQVGVGTPVGPGLCLGIGENSNLWKALSGGQEEDMGLPLRQAVRETGPNFLHISLCNEKNTSI
jgi:hypothetical protein